MGHAAARTWCRIIPVIERAQESAPIGEGLGARVGCGRVPRRGLGQAAFNPDEHHLPDAAALREADRKLGGSVQFVRGVGPALAEKFRKAGVLTIRDLLAFFPLRYEDRRNVTRIADLCDGERASVTGTVLFSGVAFYRGLRRRVYEVVLRDDSGELRLKWFNFVTGSLEARLKRDRRIVACGTARSYRNRMEMHHPDVEVFAGEEDTLSFGRIVPVYREIGGLYQKTLRKIMRFAVATFAGERLCTMPPEICRRRDLLPPWRALREIHEARELKDAQIRSKAEESLAFEELFFYCVSLALRKRLAVKEQGISFAGQSPSWMKMRGLLPFRLTDSQRKVLSSIRSDMRSPHPMNRLLQGDVGSGKTVVAFLSALVAIDHGYQAAFLAPTEILAEQHMETFRSWAESLGVRVELLLGKTSSSARREVLDGAASGGVQLLVGTHAILEGDVRLRKLGFVVVDEQHRFGVRQRAAMRDKGPAPDVLVMSATPIPRTLALTLYGDLDVSTLEGLPPGRKRVETRLYYERDRMRVYEAIRVEVSKGRQAYVVYPLVSPSENLDARDATSMSAELSEKHFPDVRVGLIHGQMPADEKERVMAAFRAGDIHVLVSTTVIEVGIDVANATVMLIEHPERFGLSQLHQLRGRVGRGDAPSRCLLILPPGSSPLSRQRLRTFASVSDGFVLAEEDLRMRGPGDFFGTAQSGFPSFDVAVFPRDLDILEAARREAFTLVESDPELKEPPHRHVSWLLSTVWKDRLRLAKVG